MLSWKRNLAVLFGVQLLSTAGFSLIFPFLSLYVDELGIATGGSVALWAGLVFSAQAVTMMIAAPIWGSVADRRGRKLMLERATIGGAIIMVAMGFARNAEQLVILRAAQGMVTGVIAATNALVAASTPRKHTGFALGTLNMSRWVGVAAGPILGGYLGEHFGFRESFWITGCLLGLAGIAVAVLVKENFTPKPRTEGSGFVASYRRILRSPGMAGLYQLTFLRSLGATLVTPFMALFVLSLMHGTDGAASTTGLVIGASALTSALSAVYFGRLGDRVGHSRVLIGSALAAMVLNLPQVFVTEAWQLIVLQALAGLAVGGLVPSSAALMNLWSPAGSQGATYGMENSVQASARVVAPMLAAAIATWIGYRGLFVGTAIVYLGIAFVAWAIVRGARSRRALVLEAHPAD